MLTHNNYNAIDSLS